MYQQYCAKYEKEGTKMPKIIAISNQKGGVGKTTTTASLIAGLANRGYKTLGIDMDPQGNLTDSFGAEAYEKPTAYELIKEEIPVQNIVQRIHNFDLIPSNIMLAGAEQELTQTGKEHRLKETVKPIQNNYDYIIIDTPPSLGVLTVNAFTFADEVIIPTTAGIFAAKGIQQLYKTIKSVQRYCNANVDIKGILITRFDSRTNIGKQIKYLTEQLGEHIQTIVFNTSIRNGIAIEEAQANSRDIFSYSKDSNVAKDYDAFINEYLKETPKNVKSNKTKI